MQIYLDSLGCRLNRGEIEQLASELQAAGHRIVGQASEADLAILNTCAVTQAAVSDSRQRSRNLAAQGVSKIVLTGCWASLEPEAVGTLPGHPEVVPNSAKDGLLARLKLDQEILPIKASPGQEQQRHPRKTRAFIKVQDGCDLHCTFCVTTLARGASQSRPLLEILDAARKAELAGHKEIVLCGVQLGSWGAELQPRMALADLLRAMLMGTSIPRIRLSSLEPWSVTPELLELWVDERLCRHLHLPLQSGSSRILRRMKRRTGLEAFERIMQQVRASIPLVAVTTDIIVGFPGEGEREFEESVQFIDRMNFSGGHVFTYDERPGTEAATYTDQVPNPIRRDRNREVRARLRAASQRFRAARLGMQTSVLWEGNAVEQEDGWQLEGWSEEYLRVRASSPQRRTNEIDKVLLTALDQDGMLGAIQS